MLSQTQLRGLVRSCAESIERRNAEIRTLQNEMLDQVPLEQWPLATAALDAMLGKNRIIHMAETNTFSNVGVANTGQMSGTISGNSQHIEVNESAKQLLQAFEGFKTAVSASHELSPEQKEDALGAAKELEEQATAPEGSRVMSKVRNAVAALKTLASGTQALHSLYEQVHPLLASHFHLLQ